MPNLSINIIGAGKLGKTIGYLINKHNLAQIKGVFNHSKKSSLEAIAFMGVGQYYPEISQLPTADLTLIAVPDDQIVEISICLSQQSHITSGNIIFHCSGVLSSDILEAVKQKGCLVASIHPIFSFATPENNVNNYINIYCTVEGDSHAIKIISKIFTQIGSIPFAIQKEQKALYHAGCVFSSNYLITLVAQAMHCFTQSGIEKKIAFQAILNIMQNTLNNLKYTESTEKALTGPIKRGDIATLEKHMQSLSGTEQHDIYALLGQLTLPLTKHNQKIMEKIKRILTLR